MKRLTAHIDILPTLLELCEIKQPANLEFDGSSLVPLLKNPESPDWPDRTLVVENQRVVDPVKWRNTSVMTDRWRFVDNRELYDIQADPGQKTNVIEQHPDLAAKLSSFYDSWWTDVSRRHNAATRIHVGVEQENPVQLSSHDWMPPMTDKEAPPWNQPDIERRPVTNGTWYVNVVRSGRYAIILRERPAIAAFPLRAIEAQLQIGSHEKLSQKIADVTTGVRFELDLTAGETAIHSSLIEVNGETRGAYYADVEYLEDTSGK